MLPKWHLRRGPVYATRSRYSRCFFFLVLPFFLGRKSFLTPYSLLLIVYWNFVPMLMEHETKRIAYHWPRKSNIQRWQLCPEAWTTHQILCGPLNLCEWHCHPPFHSSLKPETHSWFFSCQQELAPKHILYLSLSLLLYCYYPGPNRHHFSPRILQYFSHKATRIIL